MMPGPQLYVGHLTQEGYHPRSDKHGKQLALLVLDDVLEACEPLRAAAARGRIVYALNFNVFVADPTSAEELPQRALKDLAWNIDLVLGPAARQQARLTQPSSGSIPEGVPERIWLALDSKGVMTEHGKARRNRQRDVTALSAVMHLFRPLVVVGATIPVNISRRFNSPLRSDITDHGEHIVQVVADTLAIFRAVRVVASRIGTGGIEGLGCFVVDYENTPGSKARLHLDPPAPQENDIIHYDQFVVDLASALMDRFGGEM